MLKVGDKIRFSDYAVARGIYAAITHVSEIGNLSEVITEWDENDSICWEYHVSFGEFKERIYGVMAEDITLVEG